ncbi:MAG: amidohydrolase family protein [Pseudomonadota bacterium]
MIKRSLLSAAACLFIVSCGSENASEPQTYDLIIRNGMIYDGSGGAPEAGDLAIVGDRVVARGDLSGAEAEKIIDADGHAVAPGFINILSWSTESLLQDGRGMSVIKQGVTLEVMGEGTSMGPLTDEMRDDLIRRQAEIQYDIPWTTLGQYLQHLEDRGVSPNVASFIGAATVRIHEIGYDDRPATETELAAMQELVRQAMKEGALGVGSSLIYPPANFASTEELTALTAAAAEMGGGYTTHMRSEGDRFLEGIDETLTIARNADTWAQIYHFKPAGQSNWDKHGEGLAKLDAARAEGIEITADVYTYTAGATGLDVAFPPWSQEGGNDAWFARLEDPELRARVIAEMRDPNAGYENLYLAAGSPENVLLIGFDNPALRPLTGKSLAEVAAMRGTSPEDTIVDLVLEDRSRVDTAYYLMSDENVKANIRWPYMMFGSDGAAVASEPPFTERNPHPRSYGNFARLLGKYVREEQVISLEEAIQRLTRLSAETLRLEARGCIDPGCYADVVVFDPETIGDRATFADPHQYSVGVEHVVVNGVHTLAEGEHTGAFGGRFVKGPGFPGVR